MSLLPPVVAMLTMDAKQFEATMLKAKGTMTEVAAHGKGTFDTLSNAGRMALMGIAGGAAAIGVSSVKMAGDFQEAMTRLVTGAGESQKNIKLVHDGILAMAPAVGTGPQELAKSMYLIESAGFHGADGLKVLHAAAQGAKADGADVNQVGNALTTVMKDMHAPASQAGTVMAKMVAAVAAGKMTMDQLAGSIHSVLPNAVSIGLGFDQVGGALATMTAQGLSADQAAQNLNHTIVKLAAPTASMTQAMASYGLNAADVSKNLGKAGLTGTLDELVNAVTTHMGPAGVTLRSAFNQSQAAAQDAQRMFASLPASVQDMAKAYATGQVSMGDFRKEVKALPADQASLIMQWKASEDGAKGFSSALKGAKQDGQTFTAAMKDMLGDQTGLQVALHLTGDASKDFAANVKTIHKTSADAHGNLKDWSEVQKNFNFQLAQTKATVSALAIQIGDWLIPKVELLARDTMTVVDWFKKHKDAAEALGIVVGGSLAIAIGAFTVNTMGKLIGSVKDAIGFVTTLGEKLLGIGGSKAAVDVSQSGGGATGAGPADQIKLAMQQGGEYAAGAIRDAMTGAGKTAGGSLAAGEVAGGKGAAGELTAGEVAGGKGAGAEIAASEAAGGAGVGRLVAGGFKGALAGGVLAGLFVEAWNGLHIGKHVGASGSSNAELRDAGAGALLGGRVLGALGGPPGAAIGAVGGAMVGATVAAFTDPGLGVMQQALNQMKVELAKEETQKASHAKIDALKAQIAQVERGLGMVKTPATEEAVKGLLRESTGAGVAVKSMPNRKSKVSGTVHARFG